MQAGRSTSSTTKAPSRREPYDLRRDARRRSRPTNRRRRPRPGQCRSRGVLGVAELALRAYGTEENELAVVAGRVGAPPVFVGGDPDAPAQVAREDRSDRLGARGARLDDCRCPVTRVTLENALEFRRGTPGNGAADSARCDCSGLRPGRTALASWPPSLLRQLAVYSRLRTRFRMSRWVRSAQSRAGSPGSWTVRRPAWAGLP